MFVLLPACCLVQFRERRLPDLLRLLAADLLAGLVPATLLSLSLVRFLLRPSFAAREDVTASWLLALDVAQCVTICRFPSLGRALRTAVGGSRLQLASVFRAARRQQTQCTTLSLAAADAALMWHRRPAFSPNRRRAPAGKLTTHSRGSPQLARYTLTQIGSRCVAE